MQDVGQRSLDQLPAGDALDGLGQGRRQAVQLVLHQDPLKGLGRRPEAQEGGGGGQKGIKGAFLCCVRGPDGPSSDSIMEMSSHEAGKAPACRCTKVKTHRL